MTRDEALNRAAIALGTADLHAATATEGRADLDRAQTWMDLADRLPGGQVAERGLRRAGEQLLAACAAEDWKPDAVAELLGQFFDAQGFHMSGRPS